MNASLVSSQIDEQTKEELQPPCEAKDYRTDELCGQPCAWAVRVRCPADMAVSRALVCGKHLASLAQNRTTCTLHPITVPTVLSVEPLR